MLKAVDQATAPIKRLVGTIGDLGLRMLRVDRLLVGSARSMFRAVTSLRGAMVGLVGVLAVRAVANSLGETVSRLDELGERSREFGIAAGQLSVFEYAAKRANVESDSLALALKTGTRNLGEFAATGKGPAAEAAARLGLKFTDAEGRARSLGELIPEIGDAIAGLGQGERLAALSLIFGKGAEAIERLTAGGNLSRFRAELEALGGVVTANQVQVAGAVDDALDRIDVAWEGLKTRVVESIGPTLAVILNNLAIFVAMVPTILGRAATFIGDVFGPEGSVRTAARAQLDALLGDLADFALVVLRRLFGVLLAGTLVVFNALWAALTPELKAGLVKAIISATVGAISSIDHFIGDRLRGWGEQVGGIVGSVIAGVGHGFKALGTVADIGQLGMNAVVDDFFAVNHTLETFNLAAGDAGRYTRMLADAIAALKSEAGDAGGKVVADLDAILGFMEEYNRRAEALRQAMGSIDNPFDTAAPGRGGRPGDPDPSDFLGGLKQGITDVRKQAAELYQFGRQLVTQLSAQISSELSTAIIDVVTGVKSLKDAFREFAAGTLRMVSQLILQMLILRAISGIIGAFGGGGSEVGASVGSTSTNIPDFAGPSVQTFANSGGVIGRIGRRGAGWGWAAAAGLALFGGGGFVGAGPNVNRDSVLAGLTMGEGVLNRGAVRNNGVATLAYMNNGGRVVPDDGRAGGGVNVYQNVTIQGGGVDARAVRQLREASRDGVLDALRREPGYRESVKRALS